MKQLFSFSSCSKYPFQIFTSELQISGTCPGTYDTPTFTYIKSPNHPLNYEKNTDCSWLITAPREKSIVLSFANFDIGKRFDMLRIYEGDNAKSNSLEEYRGNSNPLEKWINAKSLYVTFTSSDERIDASYTRRFKMLLQAFGK